MAQHSWDHRAGGWVRDDRGGRPVGPWRGRRLDRANGPVGQGRNDGSGGGALPSGDRVPRRPVGPVPSLSAELELPRSR